MFKRFMFAATILAVLAGGAMAEPKKTTLLADGVIVGSPGYVGSVIIVTDGANTCTATLYDSTVLGGAVMFGLGMQMNGTDNFGGFTGVKVPFTYGLYLDINSSGSCAVTVNWAYSSGDL